VLHFEYVRNQCGRITEALGCGKTVPKLDRMSFAWFPKAE